MALQNILLDLEEQFWKGGGDIYRERLTDDALVVIPNEVLDKDRTVAAIDASARWADVRFDDLRIVYLHDATAVVTYRASAHREGDGFAYAALVGSVYVQRNGAWLLAFHQQTPVMGG